MTVETGGDTSASTAARDGTPDHQDAWVTVGEAAERAGVSTSTVRHWYRSGRVATQRAADRGPFLVPLPDVVALADIADGDGDAAEDTVIDINASYWSLETETARADAAAAAAEATRLAGALDVACARAEQAEAHIDLLRGHVFELEAAVASLREELATVHATAAFAAATDQSGPQDAEHGYRGAARPQQAWPGLGPDPDDDTLDATGTFDAPVPFAVDEGADDDPGDAPLVAPRPAWAGYGTHGDDLLPGAGRRRRS